MEHPLSTEHIRAWFGHVGRTIEDDAIVLIQIVLNPLVRKLNTATSIRQLESIYADIMNDNMGLAAASSNATLNSLIGYTVGVALMRIAVASIRENLNQINLSQEDVARGLSRVTIEGKSNIILTFSNKVEQAFKWAHHSPTDYFYHNNKSFIYHCRGKMAGIASSMPMICPNIF